VYLYPGFLTIISAEKFYSRPVSRSEFFIQHYPVALLKQKRALTPEINRPGNDALTRSIKKTKNKLPHANTDN
jgi:hypothetical protein